jgi:hypothetical protein
LQLSIGSPIEVRSFYDYHLALAFNFGDDNNDDPDDDDERIWIVEMARKSTDNVIGWKDENSVSVRSQSRIRVLEDRKRLGLLVFRLGQIGIDLRDVGFWCETLPLIPDPKSSGNPKIRKAENSDNPICHFWIQSLAAKLNLPNQHILELLSKGRLSSDINCSAIKINKKFCKNKKRAKKRKEKKNFFCKKFRF